MYVKMVSLCSKVSKGVGYMDTQYICTSKSESEVHMYSMYCILLENTLVAYSLLGDLHIPSLPVSVTYHILHHLCPLRSHHLNTFKYVDIVFFLQPVQCSVYGNECASTTSSSTGWKEGTCIDQVRLCFVNYELFYVVCTMLLIKEHHPFTVAANCNSLHHCQCKL